MLIGLKYRERAYVTTVPAIVVLRYLEHWVEK
jgi:hypothetical protein